jgi:hypothetical protein
MKNCKSLNLIEKKELDPGMRKNSLEAKLLAAAAAITLCDPPKCKLHHRRRQRGFWASNCFLARSKNLAKPLVGKPKTLVKKYLMIFAAELCKTCQRWRSPSD